MVWLNRQDDFRNFCITNQTEKAYHKKLEEAMQAFKYR